MENSVKLDDITKFMNRAACGEGRIVSSNDLSVLQIQEARTDGRFLVTDDGLGWAILPWHLRTRKDAEREAARPAAPGKVVWEIVESANNLPSLFGRCTGKVIAREEAHLVTPGKRYKITITEEG